MDQTDYSGPITRRKRKMCECVQPTYSTTSGSPLSDVNTTISNFTEINQLQQELNNLNISLQESSAKLNNKYDECSNYQVLNKMKITNDSIN